MQQHDKLLSTRKNKDRRNYLCPMIIFARIVRLREAALLLPRGDFPSEAGIIVLAQFEAKVDLAQAVSDGNWATRWIEHHKISQSLEKVAESIKTIFDDEQDRAIEKSVFHYLSIIKHGNPLSSELAFQVRRSEDLLMVSTGEMKDSITTKAGVMMAEYATFQLAWAAQVISSTIVKYAIVDPEKQQAVYDNWQRISDFGKTFAQFLESFSEGRAGHLNIGASKSSSLR